MRRAQREWSAIACKGRPMDSARGSFAEIEGSYSLRGLQCFAGYQVTARVVLPSCVETRQAGSREMVALPPTSIAVRVPCPVSYGAGNGRATRTGFADTSKTGE